MEPRQRDPRIAEQILRVIGSAGKVVSIGNSAGFYEPDDAHVTAVDPAGTIASRPAGVEQVIHANAETLPFRTKTFDVAMAVNSLHTFIDAEAGLAEMDRVARQVVIVTWDSAAAGQWWWMGEYFTGLHEVGAARFPPVDKLAQGLKQPTITPVLIPHDCQDGFLGAYWRRPHAYLDATVRAGMSAFGDPRVGEVHEGITRLSADLANGRWLARWAPLLDMDECDLGYRLVVTPAPRRPRASARR